MVGPVTRGAALALPAMPADVEELMSCESFSADHATVARSAEVIGALGTITPGARLEVLGGAGRPPIEPGSSADLFALASRVAAELGQAPLRGTAVGGASDGNYTAATGSPTLDSLGAVGGGAHGDTEYVEVARMIPCAPLLAELITRIVR
ncbi:M20/M25/M40 family metallo-hydrolase [Streptomyces sp. V1I1]|uniref:M20/M25/M40 family metallo-hydrolase n=1 Tax=Streptomyces sp. V1I1 TaxID=3042272 RepID=UPI00277E44C7|nr:M20/M25/M40 family metallo-hydrolase [Streptomyces sp. V1I1]MDQ0942761.1 acetylornithine deacetylase/succinyl-diaminopimelate desuccinylase-like protein [Streptomyces sp. V1I1]